MKNLIFFCATILTIQVVIAQKPPIKFGDVSAKDLKSGLYQKDTTAEAVILADYGVSEIVYNQNEGFRYHFERITRIKIITKEGFDWADVSIPYYHSASGRENIGRVRGFTYNLEKGKLVKTKLGKDDMFTEEYNKNWDLQKFTMPNVKEGSIIEYNYSIRSDFFRNLRDWEFQKTIPVVWSEYIVRIPEYFNYQKLSQGYLPLDVAEEETNQANITLTSKSRSTSGSSFNTQTQTNFSSNTLSFQRNDYRYVMKDVPAFRSEPYITTSKNYISKISFELDFIKWPDGTIKRYLGTWPQLTETYLDFEDFGIALNHTGFIKNELPAIIYGANTDEEKMLAIYNHIKSNIQWNEFKGEFVTSSLRKAYSERKGNAADINLNLVAFLREAGLTADPVLISTRDNGYVNQSYPISQKFNYVICKAEVNGKKYLLDATDPFMPFGVLPYRCLNGKGWVVSKQRSGWVNLTANAESDDFIIASLAVNSEGTFTGEMSYSSEGYSAFSYRKMISRDGEEAYISKIKNDNPDWLIEEYKFENLKDNSKPMVQTYDVELTSMGESLGSMIYIDPLFGEGETENEFKLEERAYPVDLGYPRNQQFNVTITIPENYLVEELPKSTGLALPNKDAVFRFSVSQSGNTIQVISILSLNKGMYLPGEYPALRQFFDQVVAKHGERIVLKKKT